MTSLRIFVSSPGDVGEERTLTARVLRHLNEEFSGHIRLEPVFWEHEPLRATASFQEELPRPSQSDVCVLILWSRLGTRLPAHITRADGSRYASGTEFEFEDALEGHRTRGLPDLLVYRKSAKPVTELDSEEQVLDRLSQKRALEGFINKWFRSDDGSFTAAFHSFENPAAFEQLLEEHLRKLIGKRLGQARSDLANARWKAGSPFRGLQVFEYEHAPIFFGRTEAISELLNALRRQAAEGRAFVLVLGMSGCGKSSLIRAGVLPRLTQPGVIEGIGLWRRAIVRPGDNDGHLFDALAVALLRPEALGEIAAAGTDAAELAALLRETPKAAVPLIKSALAQAAGGVQRAEKLAAPPAARLALFVDQLEELFTLERITAEERTRFIAAISALARSGAVWILSTLRSDFYAQASDLAELLDLKEGAGQYDLLPPTPAEIGQMIRQPARMAGLRFEEHPTSHASLDDQLCDAAARDPEALPLLEFALEQLYKRCDEGVLTYAAYDAMGGVEQALATHAEEIFVSLPAENQASFGAVLGAVVTPGLADQQQVARRRAPLAALHAIDGAVPLVEAFITHRLFVTDRADDGTAVVSVAHEALLRRWPRVADWVRDNARVLRIRARIAAGTALWREQGRAPAFLLPGGAALNDAGRLLESDRAVLSDDEIGYVDASRRRQRGRVRRRRLLIGAVAVVLLAALGAGLWYRDAYVTPRIEYYADLAKRFGHPEGRRRLSAEQAAGRDVTLRFTRLGRRGPVQRIESINGYGQLTTNHGIGSYIGNSNSALLGAARECRWDFILGPDGHVAAERAFSRTGRLIYEFAYSSPTTGYYKDPNGYPLARAGSGAAYVTFVRETQGPNAGLDIEIRYTDARGRPQANLDGTCGMRLSYDQRGLVTGTTNLAADGRPGPNHEGIVSIRYRLDDQGQIVEFTQLDARDQPMRGKYGYAAASYTLDAAGNRVQSVYLDDRGQPVRVAGAAIVRAEFNERGQQVQEAYFDEAGQPTVNQSLLHRAVMGYDARGNTAAVDYFDEAGRPVRNKQFMAGIRRKFDEQNFLIEELYVDEDHRPVLTADGYAKLAWRYDARGNMTDESAYDEQDRLIARADHTARRVYRYDERDNNVEVLCYDERNQPTRCKEGYARRVNRYDDRGNTVESTFFGPDDKPALYDNDYARITWAYDESGNKIDERYFGADFKPVRIGNGYARQAMRYDERGKCIERIYYDRNDNPAWDKDGAARYTMRYDERGNITEVINFDRQGDPIRTRRGYAGILWTYDARGKMLSETTVDEQRQPVAVDRGYARTEWTYDAYGHATLQAYFGPAGEPRARNDGIARIERRYDARGNEIQCAYFGAGGQPARHPDGNCGYRNAHDPRGQIIQTTYTGPDGEPCLVKDGYASVRYAYDRRGNTAGARFFGTDDQPIIVAYNYAAYASDYDARGRTLETRYLGLDGKPARTTRNFSTLRYAYDDRGNEIERRHLGPDGALVEDPDGLARVARKYDERGKLLEEHYFGADDRPTLVFGYAAMRRAYDDRGNQVSETYLDAQGKPRATANGYAAWIATFDQRGNNTLTEFRDAEDRPAARSDGVARIRRSYDERGNKVQEAFFDPADKPFAPPDAHARATWKFDERDREIQVAYFDAADNPVVESDGFARRTGQYDDHGHLVEQAYFDAAGQPTLAAGGYARHTLRYDDHGNIVQEAFFGVQGQPVANNRGYARLVADYDAFGNPLTRAYYNADGKIVPTRVVIVGITSGMHADTLDLRTGDILDRYNDQSIVHAAAFTRMVSANTRPVCTLVVIRDDKPLTFSVPPGLLGIDIEDWVVESP